MWKHIILGLLLGASFGLWFKQKVNARPRVKGPSSKKVIRTIFHDKLSNQHYRFEPVTHVCPPSVDVDELEHSEDSE